MSDENRRPPEAPSAEDVCSTSATVMNDSQQELGEFREVRRRHNNNNLRQQVEDLKHRLHLQEEAIRNMGVVFSTLSGLRDHGSETNRDRRNNQNYQYQGKNYNSYNSNYSRRGRTGNWTERAF